MGRGGKNLDPLLIVDDEQQEPSMMTTSRPKVLTNGNNKQQYTWNEIRCHPNNKIDRWLVIDKRVYNVARWTKHPGGQIVLKHYAGQDATVRNNSFRNIRKLNSILGSFPCSSS
jgi:cytochrome b involved in lipid metabolism